MDSKHEQLLDKYWRAESIPEEETMLKKYFLAEDDAMNQEEHTYFQKLGEFSQLRTNVHFDNEVLQKLKGVPSPSIWPALLRKRWQIAATVLVAISLSVFLFQRERQEGEPIAADEDLQNAFELTKQALLLVSTELNKGATYTVALDKFDETMEKIKNKTSK